MIPKLTLDLKSICSVETGWKDKEDQEWVKDFCKEFSLHKNPNDQSNFISIYQCDNNWVDLGVFSEFKEAGRLPVSYGYCDREEDLYKYLQTYLLEEEINYFVNFGFMNMNYEKYYKNGSYINKGGINTHEDYYNYIGIHPDEKGRQQIKDKWITFAIFKLIK